VVTIPVTVLPCANSSTLSSMSTVEVMTVIAAPTTSDTLAIAPKPWVLELSNDTRSPTL